MSREEMGPSQTTEATRSVEPEREGQYGVRSLVRGLQVIRCFNVDNPAWTLAEISRRTGLHRATAYRLLRTLEAEGFLTYDPKNGTFRLGSALMPIAYLSTSNAELVKKARPFMERLATTIGETVDLAVWTASGPMLVDMVPTSRPFKWVLPVGHVFPAYGNVHGKIYLAYCEMKRRDAFKKGLVAASRFGPPDPTKINETLNRVAAEGIAYDFQENGEGVCAVGAPIRDFSGDLRATLAVVAPVERFGPQEVEQYVVALKDTALSISRHLGYPSPQDA